MLDLIRSCWLENPEQRPTFQQIRTTLRKMTEGESVFLTHLLYYQTQNSERINLSEKRVIMAAAGHSVLPLYLLSFFSSPPMFRRCLSSRHQTLRLGCLSPPSDIWRPKNIKISARFRTTSRLDREYLRNATRYRQSENGVANYGHSRTYRLNSMYVRPQTAQNRTGILTHLTGSHQAGHCHAFS